MSPATNEPVKSKVRFATMWLDGCSGCHMSLLDMDERLIEIADRIEMVYGPLVDAKEYPHDVDVALIEGAVSSVEDRHKLLIARERTKVLVVMGDCAVTSNVPGMRNKYPVGTILDRAYVDTVTIQPGHPTEDVPALLPHALPAHEVVAVDLFVPGCPPPADALHFVIAELLEGRTPDPTALTRFGR
jgi:NAD-reducing hydrogenase small subunit